MDYKKINYNFKIAAIQCNNHRQTHFGLKKKLKVINKKEL